MKLEEGMYVKTKKYGIAKVIGNVDDNKFNIDIFKKDGITLRCKKMKDIIKASHNIVDLIEVGDYVNGYKVSFKGNDYKPFVQCDYPVQCGTTNHYRFYEESIYSIVTREMFSNAEYRVGTN